jgi:hypothetical protein
MDILHGIESKALALREAPPPGALMTIADSSATIELPLERPLFTPSFKPLIADMALQLGDEHLDSAALYAQVVVDKPRLARHIRQTLQLRSQVTLRELVETEPLQHGLAELVAYLQLGTESFQSIVDEKSAEVVEWEALASDGASVRRQARLPRVIFVR